jgi:predicted MFS family arabinose efflux permease
MEMNASSPSPWKAALGGLATLALIIGIGRFAFTPILPMMQADFGVTVAQGGWLASVNYLGYLIGGLSAMRSGVRPRLAIRVGLIAIVLCTLAMAFVQHFFAWIVLRTIPGFASAWVMVYVSAWVLEKLTQNNRSDLGGVVYAGVGVGIVIAGLACLALLRVGGNSDEAWIALGVIASLIVLVVWPVLGDQRVQGRATSTAPIHDSGSIPEFWRLVLCYGAFGLGYIIPATFLPVMAKQVVPDPGWFGWAWPVFGIAAALSTLLAARLGRLMSNRMIWILGNVTMAAGVVVPIAVPDLVGIVIAAVCVGGTFMVITMVGLQEARKVAGNRARVLMGAMTSSFAFAQILGALLVSSLAHLPNGFTYALIASAVPLVFASYTLLIHRGSPLASEVVLTK